MPSPSVRRCKPPHARTSCQLSSVFALPFCLLLLPTSTKQHFFLPTGSVGNNCNIRQEQLRAKHPADIVGVTCRRHGDLPGTSFGYHTVLPPHGTGQSTAMPAFGFCLTSKGFASPRRVSPHLEGFRLTSTGFASLASTLLHRAPTTHVALHVRPHASSQAIRNLRSISLSPVTTSVTAPGVTGKG